MMKHKSFRGLGAILFKEFIVVWRDPMTLFFMFFPPLIEMIAFGYALDTDVKHMAMLILNEDRTVESRQFIDRFVNTETFRVVGEVQSLDQMKSEMRKGRAYAGAADSAELYPRTCAPVIRRRCNCLSTDRIPRPRCRPSIPVLAWR